MKKTVILLCAIFLAMGVSAQVVLTISQDEVPASKNPVSPGQTGIVALDATLTVTDTVWGLYFQFNTDVFNQEAFENARVFLNDEDPVWQDWSSGGLIEAEFPGGFITGTNTLKVLVDVSPNALSGALQVSATPETFVTATWDTIQFPNGYIQGSAEGGAFAVDQAPGVAVISCDDCVETINLPLGTESVVDAHTCHITNGVKIENNVNRFMYEVYSAYTVTGLQAQLYMDGAPVGAPAWVDGSNEISFDVPAVTFTPNQDREIAVEMLGTSAFNGVFQVGLKGAAFRENRLTWNGENLFPNAMLGPMITIGSPTFDFRLTCNSCLSAQALIPTIEGVKVFKAFLTNLSSAGEKAGFSFKLNSPDISDFSGWDGTFFASQPYFPGSEQSYDNFIGKTNFAADGTCVVSEPAYFELGETKEISVVLFLREDVTGDVTCSLTGIQGESTDWNGNELSSSNPFEGPVFTFSFLEDATIYCDDCVEDQNFDIPPQNINVINFSVTNNSAVSQTYNDIFLRGVSDRDSITFLGWDAQLRVNEEPILPQINVNEQGFFEFTDRGIVILPGETKQFRIGMQPPKEVGAGSFRVNVTLIRGVMESPIGGAVRADVFWNGERLSETNAFIGPRLSFAGTAYLEEDTTTTKSAHLKSAFVNNEDESVEVLSGFIKNGENSVPLISFTVDFRDTISFGGGMMGKNVYLQLWVDDQSIGEWHQMNGSVRILQEVSMDSLQVRKISFRAKGLTSDDALRFFALTKITGGVNVVWNGQELTPFNPFYGPLVSTIITAVDDPIAQSEVRVYPNPVRDQIRVTGLPERSVYRVYTTAGQLVQTAEFENKIDCQSWQPGMYILFIKTSQGVINKSIIKL